MNNPQAKRGRTKPPRAECSAVRDGDCLRIQMPWPPPLNHLYRNFHGRSILSKEGRRFKASTECLLIGARPWTGPVSVRINLYRPEKRGDIDSYNKLILDALQGCAFVNDKQVSELYIRRDDDKQRPRVMVEVRPVKGSPEEMRILLSDENVRRFMPALVREVAASARLDDGQTHVAKGDK